MLGGVLAGDLLHRLLQIRPHLMHVEAEEGVAEDLKQQLMGAEAAEADPIDAGERTLEDRVDHQVIAVGRQRITPAQFRCHPAFIARDPVHLHRQGGVEIEQKGAQDVGRQQGGAGAVGGIAQQFIQPPVAVEEISKAA